MASEYGINYCSVDDRFINKVLEGKNKEYQRGQ